VACRTPRATLVVFTATALLLQSTWFSATAVIPQVRAEWQLSAEAVAWLTIAVQWGFVTGALLSAAFTVADAIAPNRLIFLCSLGAAGANLLLLATQGVGLGVTARFATGLFIAGGYPPALKLLSIWYRARPGRGAGPSR